MSTGIALECDTFIGGAADVGGRCEPTLGAIDVLVGGTPVGGRAGAAPGGRKAGFK